MKGAYVKTLQGQNGEYARNAVTYRFSQRVHSEIGKNSQQQAVWLIPTDTCC